MIYYYFGSKDGLYLAALESVYEDLVALEKEIEIEHLDPPAAIEAMVNLEMTITWQIRTSFRFYPWRIFTRRGICASREARHVQIASHRCHCAHSRTRPAQQTIQTRCRSVDFYVSICGLCIMYFTNQHTLGVIFGRTMTRDANIQRHKRTVIDIVLSYLQTRRPNGSSCPAQAWKARLAGFMIRRSNASCQCYSRRFSSCRSRINTSFAVMTSPNC